MWGDLIGTFGLDLHGIGADAFIAIIVDSADGVEVSRQLLQATVDEFARAGGERVYRHESIYHSLRAKNYIFLQTGQIATISIANRRTPAHHHSPEIRLVGHRRNIVRGLWRDLVGPLGAYLYRIGPSALIA